MMKAKKKRRSKEKLNSPAPRGVSLIELLLAVAIGALVILAVLSLYMSGQKYFFNQDARAETIDDSRFPAEWISRDLRGALQVMSTTGSYTSSSDTIILQVYALDVNDFVIEGIFDYIIYQRNPDNPRIFERIIQANAASSRVSGTRVMADDVADVVFAYFDANNQPTGIYSSVTNVSFSVTSQRGSIFRGGQPFVETYNSWAKLRNRSI